MLSQAILAGASAQLRNAATNGGNLLQRTRCYYFYNPAYEQCNKRRPGSGCEAIGGYNRIHAVLGADAVAGMQAGADADAGFDQGPMCIATHPSDMCVALAVLGATVQVRGVEGERTIAFAEFHRLPGTTPERETNLKADELILSIDLPKEGYAANSVYVKVRDRASYAFALVSAAAALAMEGETIRSARLALGGVAHTPWRSETAEDMLRGRPATEETFRAAAELAMLGAKTFEHNAFKVEMAKRTIVRAFTRAARGTGVEA